MSTNNKWEALSMRDRAFLIREAVRNGITDIGSIRDTWEHRFDGLRDVVEKVNTSEKDFARRLRQEGRASIPDWEDPRRIATHKLGVATDENGVHYIFPSVQNVNNQLIDYTNPKTKGHGYEDMIAAERGDTIQIGNTGRDLRNAIKFTEKYKKLGIYPEFSESPHTFSGEDDVNPIIDFSKKAVEKAKNTWGNLKKFVTEAFTPDDSDRTFHTIKESDVTRGAGYLYDPDFYKYNTVFKDSTNNKLYFYPDDISNIDILEIPRAYEPISKDEVRKLLPKRDYVGGRNNLETRNKAATLIPGLLDSIQAISGRHKIPAGLMHHRIGKEGYYDANAWEYNYVLHTDEMPGYWENIANKEVDGFGLLGLDDAGTLLQNGDIKLTKHVSWKPKVHRNEKNREVISVWTPTLWDALEIKAGDIKYRQEEMRKRGYKGKDLETWTNAAYNLGMYHKDLEKKEWIRKNYTVPDYSNLFKK